MRTGTLLQTREDLVDLGAPDRKRDSGATLVEFAIVMPLLLLLMIGIMEVGVAFYEYLTIERATLEGVRTAAFTGTTKDADCAAIRNAVAAPNNTGQ